MRGRKSFELVAGKNKQKNLFDQLTTSSSIDQHKARILSLVSYRDEERRHPAGFWMDFWTGTGCNIRDEDIRRRRGEGWVRGDMEMR